MTDPIVLTGADLSIADVEAAARHGAPVRLDDAARGRMQEARDVIEALVAEGAVVYGVTTGFGDLATTFIEPSQAGQLQENLLMSHAAGVGPPFSREVVRAMLLLRANTLALGHSGCRPLLVDRLLAFLEKGIHPVVPEQGSLGASGDLAPLAHLALPLIGRGEVEMGGRVLPAGEALAAAGLDPLELQAKEGLALLNGTQMMGALAALFLADADRLVRTASVAAAQSVEALLGTDVAFAAAYQLARPHPGQLAVAAEMRHLLRDSGLQQAHHGSTHKVQDPYSLRCVPQVHGAVRDALDQLRRVLDIELNSATDNPLVFPGGGVVDPGAIATGGGQVISGGNFHGEPLALALDYAKLAIAELGSISERRMALLVDPRLNGGLSPFLAAASGVESGMMIYQYTAAALVSEHKVLTMLGPSAGRLDSRTYCWHRRHRARGDRTLGVIAYAVARRTREIGIRMALGAAPGGVIRLVMRQGLSVAGAGLAVGMLLAWLAARALSSGLYGVSALDPVAWAGALALSLASAAAANFIPARRASKVDPSIALRTE